MPPAPVLPDYGGGCISSLAPALLGPSGTKALPSWMPAPARDAAQTVLLVLDGLGWQQLQSNLELCPTLHRMTGAAITTVVPSTTATALSSITTGLAPGEHGVVGYRMEVQGEILNVLRWGTSEGDARKRIRPTFVQPVPAFLGASVPAVTKADFVGSGFTAAHLGGVRHHSWRMPSTLLAQVASMVDAGETFVYAYYDGVDKVAHEFGFGPAYKAELVAADRLVADLLKLLPPTACLLVTADHGQVIVGTNTVALGPDVQRLVRNQSGEGRFRWLHARPGGAAELLAVAKREHNHHAWVHSVQEVIDAGWFGPQVTLNARSRLGDVALVPFTDISFDDPADSGPFPLVSRHGSLTAEEMLVPLLAARGER
jgi:predicted AlkP superfamily pyrophosphatase or phosphodiesterase